MEEDGDKDVEHIATLEDVEHELLVDVAHPPKEYKELLVELDLLTWSGQVGLHQRIVEQPGQALEDESKVLAKIQ